MSNELIPINSSLNLEPSSKETRKLKLAIDLENSNVLKNTVVSIAHEQGRALLTKSALENIAALSALENHLFKIAPLGQERYKQILDAYAVGAAQKIWRW